MNNKVMTYEQALSYAGSSYRLSKMVVEGNLYKISRGLYSTEAHPDPLIVVSIAFPDAIVTMDSALYAYGLTDVIPDRIHLATRRETTRIKNPEYKQYFMKDELLTPGVREIKRDNYRIKLYNQERLLIEVMRRQASLPFDYYKEVIASYRDRASELDISLIEDYMALFERNDYMFDILQREVL